MKKVTILLICMSIFCVLLALRPSVFTDKKYHETARSVIGSDDFTTYKVGNQKYAVITEQDTLRYFIISTDFSRVIGYQGTTTLGIVLNADMSVQKAEILQSQETRSYVTRLRSMGFMDRFTGYRVGDDVELITGATMTCEAIWKSIDESIEKLQEILAIKP
jgi:Na+-translocating ferredoxin:NAD+ oxidoreductase RnfG subunit